MGWETAPGAGARNQTLSAVELRLGSGLVTEIFYRTKVYSLESRKLTEGDFNKCIPAEASL